MNVTELQIGDLVDYRGQIIKVTSLYARNGSNEVGFGRDDNCWVDGSVLKPIPLTPEILEKNGFVSSSGAPSYRYILDVGEDIFIVVYIFKNINKVRIKAETDNPKHAGVESTHVSRYDMAVHHLQQALRLCGIDKEISI